MLDGNAAPPRSAASPGNEFSLREFREESLDNAHYLIGLISEACSHIQQRPRSISEGWVLLATSQSP